MTGKDRNCTLARASRAVKLLAMSAIKFYRIKKKKKNC